MGTVAFMGKVIQIEKIADPPKDGEQDSCSLVFSTFMVLPLLPSGTLCREVKFSGSAKVGLNYDSLGSAVDAYAHHVAVDSMYIIVISDIQGEFAPQLCYFILLK